MNKIVKAIEWKDGKVLMLDQTRLPHEIRIIECADYMTVAEGIKRLRIRGAPAIGIAAAMGIALAGRDIKAGSNEEFLSKIEPVFSVMLNTRPTAVNIMWAVDRLRKLICDNQADTVPELKARLVTEAKNMLDEDVEINKAIGRFGSDLIKDGDAILTHCNAGSLATGGYGTATAPMLVARDRGKHIRVFADETRPVLQGARLTAWELMQEGIPVTLITDNSAGALMMRGEIDLIIVGTDRTVRNGDVANKIGTYTLAVLAKEHGIPFYVAAPLSSIDLSIPTGDRIPIEERDPSEVTHIYGKVVSEDNTQSRGFVQIAPDGVNARNIAFDVTPNRYITAIITEKGIFSPGDIKDIKR